MQRKEQEVAITEAQPKQGSSERGETMCNTDQKYADRTKHEKNVCFAEYYRYSWEQNQAPTSLFLNDLMLGNGSYGTVYKVKFQHTNAIVEVSKRP